MILLIWDKTQKYYLIIQENLEERKVVLDSEMFTGTQILILAQIQPP